MTDDPIQLKWNKRYADREWVWSPEPTAPLVKCIDHGSKGRALDLGCGEGRNALWLAKDAWSVTAVDFSSVGIDKARKTADHQHLVIEWICDNLERFSVEPHSYDLILWIYVHIPNSLRRTIWSRLLTGLKVGGQFVYLGHDLANIGRGAGGPQVPQVLSSTAEITDDLDGHDIIQASILERPVTADPGHGGTANTTALDTFVHARRPNLVKVNSSLPEPKEPTEKSSRS